MFIGPAAVLTNDLYPRSVDVSGNLKRPDDWNALGVLVKEGASLACAAVVVAGHSVGRWALVAAGAVVTRDAPDFALVAGTPARRIGWVGRGGRPSRGVGKRPVALPADRRGVPRRERPASPAERQCVRAGAGAMSSVSVVVPCYNYGHFLEECVASVLDDQDGVDVRVLIIDDASPDDSADVAKKIAARDPRVEVVVHTTNAGNIATFNEGLIEWADGDYCLLLSADDRVTPGALRRAAELLDANPRRRFRLRPCIWCIEGGPCHRLVRRSAGGRYGLESGGSSVGSATRRTRPRHPRSSCARHFRSVWRRLRPAVAEGRRHAEMYLRLAANADVGYYVASIRRTTGCTGRT